MSRAVAEININAIKSNLNLINNKTKSQILVVVKANAYGHGLIPVAKAVVESGADWLGTALLEEAIELRNSGISTPIIAWLTPPGEDFRSALELNIDLSISSLEVLDEIVLASKLVNKVPRLHIEIDTGMSRGGVRDDWEKLIYPTRRISKK
jgi:Alanine racemase